MDRLILSVIVISHNQKKQVTRCIESILSQNLPFEYEIVISDDSSTDGTWELEQEYMAHSPFIHCFQCNSDDCNPTTISERSGYNRYNAFIHSSGKYFVHIDADDYYRPGSDCLSMQVQLLEEHHNCCMCMQNDWYWAEGDSLELGGSTHPLHSFSTGQEIPSSSYFRDNLFINNAVMMIRRNNDNSPTESLQKSYVDSIITDYYLQFGPIVCLDRNDWIYSQSPGTITNKINTNDRMILWGLDLTVFSSILIPSMRGHIYSSSYAVGQLLDAIRLLISGAPISESILNFCKQHNDVFVFRMAGSPHKNIFDMMKLYAIREYIKFLLERRRLDNKLLTSILHHLCV